MSAPGFHTKPYVSVDQLCNWTLEDGCVIDVERIITYVNVEPTDALFERVRDEIAGDALSVWWTLLAMTAGLLLGLLWQAWSTGRQIARDVEYE